MKNIRCVSVGDPNSGKSNLVEVLLKQYPQDKPPDPGQEISLLVLSSDGTPVKFTFYDTSGQEKMNKLRQISYSSTDVFIAVFHLARPQTLKNLENIWLPEVCKASPNAPIILVSFKFGCDFNESIGEQIIPSSDILKLCHKFSQIYDYIENQDEIFSKAIEIALNPKPNNIQVIEDKIKVHNLAVSIGDIWSLPYCPDDDELLKVIKLEELLGSRRAPNILIIAISKKESLETTLEQYKDVLKIQNKFRQIILVRASTTDKPNDVVDTVIKQMMRATDTKELLDINENWRWEQFRDCILNPNNIKKKKEVKTYTDECIIA